MRLVPVLKRNKQKNPILSTKLHGRTIEDMNTNLLIIIGRDYIRRKRCRKCYAVARRTYESLLGPYL